MNPNKVKIVVCGPQKSGKSTIVNILADQADQLNQSGRYSPTAGVRILEVEKEVFSAGKVNIELWDTSGDQRFEPGWPAVMKDSQGVILVYNPDHPAHDQEIALWYDYFVKGAGLVDDVVLAYMHYMDASSNMRNRPPPKLSGVTTVRTNMDNSGAQLIIQSFEEFVRNIVNRT
mmetsp:Transcript_19869/g.28757  ORF Transcript_19869/g.28757 Transcript_19869/m.28757 type:complete len:174 (-) Transcript_19869:333-854(-)|eukprot:CAMPEP_0113939142 /NCGR_PEP_ID=MMETSP1339-20121228/5518_1 /TAXON_ID=94617 /ORGANISM="Fibrocapsa japonica" /LENGTH=173 /DNA_ID=CAMNT_0000942565 /DNA_START=94 /DNA_END=615 /DNA_ORIENTATION=- /assembly_acc=CAM_ASM_000762